MHRSKTFFHVFSVVIITFFLLGVSNHVKAQQKATIKGKVLETNSQTPLLNTNIILVGTQLGAATDQNGEFVITNVPFNNYQIKASYMGYESQIKDISVFSNQGVFINFDLREDFFQSEQVVVTATRTEKLMEDVPVLTELVTNGEIEEKGAEDVSEILEDRPGIAIESGTTGNKFLYMNGVDSRRILILVDNIPLSGKLNNRIQLNSIDADIIDHIEIVKGPGSALYGNDAMGGIINIITKGNSENLKLGLNGRFGSNDLYSGSFFLSGENKGLGYFFNVDHFQEGFDQGAAEIKIKDTKTNSYNGKLSYQHPAIGKINLRSEYKLDEQTSESIYHGSTNDNLIKVKNLNTNLSWSRDVASYLQFLFTGYYADNFRTYESAAQGSPMPASIDTTTDQLIGLKTDFSVLLHKQIQLVFGADFSSNDYENERLADIQNRRQSGFFAQFETRPIKNLTFNFGGRYDKITDIVGHYSPRVSALYSINSDLKLRGSWGGGFRAPSFIELYSHFPIPIPGMPMMVIGNPDLKPEKSTGGNFGLEYFPNSILQLNVTYFHNKFEDMIVDYQPAPLTFSYLNVESATFRGVEFQGRFYLLNNLTTTLSYNFTDIIQQQEDVAFSKISPHTASLRIVYGLFKNKLKISLREQFFSQRDILVVTRSSDYIKTKKDAYHVVDLTFSYKLSKFMSIKFGTTNLTNYTDEDYGPYIGRKIFFGINTSLERN